MTAGLALDEDALDWLAALLGADDSGGVAQHGAERWAVLPSTRRPRVLVPLGSRRAATAVLSRDTGFSTTGRRLMGLAFRLGFPPPGLGGRLSVSAGHPFTGWIGNLLDEPGLRAGITIGPPRPNRKPVVQLVRPDGTTAAWAKVSCTPLTRSLVINEGDWLEQLERMSSSSTGATIETPRPLARTRWHDLDVLISAPLPERDRAGGFVPDATLLRSIADLEPGGVHVATQSPWWSTLQGRADAVTGLEGRAVLGPAFDSLGERLAEVAWPFGAWHGDLTSWNARPCGAVTQIWDWERAAGRQPVGFDAVHAAFQSAQIERRLDVAEAARVTDAVIAPVLRDLEVDPATGHDLVTSYLIERWLRWNEDTRRGSGTASGDRHAAMLVAIDTRSRVPAR